MANNSKKGYRAEKLSFYRQMVIASVRQNKNSAIHCVTEVDVSAPRKLIRDYAGETGTRISFTAYITACLSQTLKANPRLNSFLKRNRIILLDDITIGVLVEREFDKEQVPEPVAIKASQNKSVIDIHSEIRKAQALPASRMGDLAGAAWIRFIPGFLLKLFVRIADQNIKMAKKYGKVAITAVGMFSKTSTWFIPHGTATVLLTVGSISKKIVPSNDGPITREFLHLTASFDHDIIDGAPAARFMKELSEHLESGELLKSVL